jgi:hypothetical protein
MTIIPADIEAAIAAISPLVSHAQWQAVRDAIGLARDQGRREMQKAAAEVAERWITGECNRIAAAIRALK